MGCGWGDTPMPRQRSYFRIDVPPHTFAPTHIPCNAIAKINTSAKISIRKEGWFNIEYPGLNATIHCTCLKINDNNSLKNYISETRELAYKHTIKASDINEESIENPNGNVWGVKYIFKGNSASFLQFFITDKKNYFMRGALYFNAPPNYDSLSPLIKYIERDIDTLIATWQFIK